MEESPSHWDTLGRDRQAFENGLNPEGLLIFEDICDFSHIAPVAIVPTWQRRVP